MTLFTKARAGASGMQTAKSVMNPNWIDIS